MRLEDLTTAFIDDVCAGKTNETPGAYRSKLRHLENFLGADYEYIDQKTIDRFRRYLLERDTKRCGGKRVKGKLSKFTVRSVLSTVRHFLRWAHEKGYIPQEVGIRNIKEPTPDPKPVEEETVTRLLKAAQTTGETWERARNVAILYILRDTGGRVGSVANLEVDSLDLNNGFATVIDKGDQLSWLWFNEPTITAIQEWLKHRYTLNPLDYHLFIGEKGKGMTRQSISRMIKHLAKATGVTGRHNPHAFRHAFARDALMAGADLGQVAQLMNHKNVVVTFKYYARWKKNELKKFHRKYSPGRQLPTVG